MGYLIITGIALYIIFRSDKELKESYDTTAIALKSVTAVCNQYAK